VLLRLVLIQTVVARNSRSATFRNSASTRYAGTARVIRPTASATVSVRAPTDLRKQAASLALLVEQSLKRDVFARHCTSSAMRDATGSGFCIGRGTTGACVEALERERFIWPRMAEDDHGCR